jgi:lipid A 3-O-deacylase
LPFLLLLPCAAAAQDAVGPGDSIITLVVENDSLAGGSDQDYSSGVRLNYTGVKLRPHVLQKISTILPIIEINDKSSAYYSLGQSIYTPKDISNYSVDESDRPWGAFLYGAAGIATFTDDHIDEMELTLGIVGPAALGKPAQTFIHKHITNSPPPHGWSHQLKNEPGLIMAWQRTWPYAARGEIAGKPWAFRPYAGATLGNVWTYADAGFILQLSSFNAQWQDTPIRVQPAMPGTGIYDRADNNWGWSIFAGLEGRAIARDIFLDGNTLATSHSVNKNTFVGDATIGASITRNAIRISYAAVRRTKSFEGQAHPDTFGAMSIGLRF